MAKFSRTQLRLGQITGSFGTTLDGQPTGAIIDNLEALASGSIVASSLSGSLSYIASAIRRLGGGDDFSVNERGHFGGTLASDYDFHVTGSNFRASKAFTFKTDSGNITMQHVADTSLYLKNDDADLSIVMTDDTVTAANEVITVLNTNGTSVAEGAAAVSVQALAGGIELRSTANLANAINITNDGGSTGTITIFNDRGTSVAEGAASVQLLSDEGGIGIKSTANLASAILITADGGEAETIKIHADQSTVDGAASAGAIELTADAGGISLNAAAGMDIWQEAGRIHVTANEDAADAIKLHADAGSDQTITIVNDAGTSEAAIALTSTAGGVDIDAAAAKDVHISGGQVTLVSKTDEASAISLTTAIGTSETIVVTNTSGTDEAAISLISTAGGVNIDAAAAKDVNIAGGQVTLVSKTDEASAISLTTAIGTSETIVVTNTSGTDAGAISLVATAGGIFLDQDDTGKKIHLDSEGTVDIDGEIAVDIDSAAQITIGGTGATHVNLGRSDKEVIVLGNLQVQGTTTTVSSSHLTVKDSIIGLGISGSDAFNDVGDRAIIFGRAAAASDFLPAVNYASDDKVEFATFNASPLSASMGAPQAYLDLYFKDAYLSGLTDTQVVFADTNGQLNGAVGLTWTDNDLVLGVNMGLQLGDATEKIEGNGDDVTITSSRGIINTSTYLSIGNADDGPGEFRFLEDSDNGDNYVGFKAAASLVSDVVWELPQNAGSVNQVLSTNGAPSNQLSWVDAGGASAQVQSGSIGASGVAAAVALTDPAQFKLTLDSSIDNSERGAKISYFVNGQLLLSGSEVERGNGSVDYNMVDVVGAAATGASIAIIINANNSIQGETLTIARNTDPSSSFTASEPGNWAKGVSAGASATALAGYISTLADLSATAVGTTVTITQDVGGNFIGAVSVTNGSSNAANYTIGGEVGGPGAFSGGTAAGETYTTAKFGFDLEFEDIVQVVVR
jgi:hypothetical protein